ncbi:MAG: nuclear transport factor 2 family protein [Anaerolineae bacterium]
MTRVVIGVTVVVAVLALPVALYAQETDLVAVVTDYYEAVNAGDVEAALALFADDGVVYMPVPPPGMPDTYTGKEEIRGWIEGEVAMNTQFDLVDSEVDGTKVTATTSVADDVLRSFGLTSLEAKDEFTIQDGKMTARTLVWTEESLAALESAAHPPAEQEAAASLPETGGSSLAGILPFLVGAGGLAVTALGWALRRLASGAR